MTSTEFIAEAQRIADRTGDAAWIREVEIRKAIVAGVNGGNAGTVQ